MDFNPHYAAKRMTFDEYHRAWDRDAHLAYRGSGGLDPLAGAVSNRDPIQRAELAGFLLDEGADPSVVFEGDHINVLHILLSQRKHDVDAEVVLLNRFIEGGADINLRSPRFGPPLQVIHESMSLRVDARTAFYDVFFARPGLDLDVALAREDGETTFRQRVDPDGAGTSDLARRVRAYDATHPKETA